MPRLLYLVTHPITAYHLMEGQLSFMRQKGFEVYLVSSFSNELEAVKTREQISIIPVEMQREIEPLHDFAALLRIYRRIRRLRPTIVNAGTPKAGLLGMLAAYLAGVPVRIYLLRGLRLETKRGIVRLLLKLTERIASACATDVIAVSESLRHVYVSMHLAREKKIRVLGHGSSNGIKFAPHSTSQTEQELLKRKLGIPQDAWVIGFVGRLTLDKGIVELLDSFEQVLSRYPKTWLLIAGNFEKGDPIPPESIEKIQQHPQIVFTGFVDNAASLYPLMDLLVFPSFREGFPNGVLEAGLAAIPVVAFRATGTVDAVEDGKTGALVPLRDTVALTSAIRRYLENESLRQMHGEAARKRVFENFRQEIVWENLYNEYVRLMTHPSRKEFKLGAFTKRLFDVLVSGLGLVIFAPIMLVIAIAILLADGLPILFRHIRPGLHGKPFTLYKFRTMSDSKDKDGNPLPDKERIFSFGQFLRMMSLDELPELFNVLKGDMSLVGPRPLLTQYVNRYNSEQARRLNAKPGITGWAQVNGRNALTWEQKLAHDVWYVDHRSSWLDIRILLLTLVKVIKREGISAEGHATMPEFMGTESEKSK